MTESTRTPALIQGLVRAYLGQYTDRTRDAYDTDLRQFAVWLASQGVGLLDAERHHVQAWDAHLRDDLGRAKATRGRKLAAVAGFYAYCEAEDKIVRSPARAVRRPKVSQDSTREGLERAELEALLKVAEQHGLQAHALVCLLALNGLRVSEACGALAENIRTVRGEQEHVVLYVTGKGDKQRPVPLAGPVLAAVRAQLDGRDTGPILAGLNRNQAWRLVKQLVAAAGITGKSIGCHSLRHTFATLALDVAPLHVVQDAMGHASPTTTRRYDRHANKLDGHAAYQLAGLLAG